MTMGPTFLSLDEAVNEIAQACPGDPQGGTARPFAFVVGAGISFPSVPLAGKIESECKDLAEKRGVKPLPGKPSAMERYSYWFGKAHSHPIFRQQYLESLIEHKEISLANFRLAHLLRAGCVANVVITPNFDNLLSRALATFGHDTFRVCDHPKTVHRISLKRPEVQIVHVHGNHWAYDQANLSGELEATAQPSATSTLSMAQLLDAILRELSPIVVGYSGWEGDVIMKALLRRNSDAYAYQSYWFCHRRTDIDMLPPWLKGRQDFVFVLPPEPPSSDRAAPPEVAGGAAGLNAAAPAERPPNLSSGQEQVAGTGDRSDRLEAYTVFDRLIVALNAESPPLFRDPLEFFAQRLVESVPKDMRVPGGAGAYSFGAAIEQIRRAQRSLLDAERTAGKAREAETLLEEVRQAIRGSRYEEALKTASRISCSDLGETGLHGLVESLSLATRNVDAKSEYVVGGLDLLINLASSVSATSSNPGVDLTLAEALDRKAFALLGRNLFDESIKVFEELVRRFGGSFAPLLQEQVARAMYNMGVALATLRRGEDAIAVYEDLERRFGNSSAEGVRDCVASALLNRGATLVRLNQNEKGMEAYDEVVRRFESSSGAALQEQVAKALYNKGLALAKLSKREAAIGVYEDLIRRLGDSTVVAVQEQVAWALYSKGYTLGKLNQTEDAMHMYDELIRRFGVSSAAAVQEPVGWALYNEGVVLENQNRTEDAFNAYDEIVRRFGGSSAAALQEVVAWALYNKGFALGNLNRMEDAISVYEELIRRLGDSSVAAVQERVAKALINRGFAQAKLTGGDEAVELYLKALRDNAGTGHSGLSLFVLFELGDAWFNLEKFDNSIEASSKAIEMAPSDYRGYYRRAGAYWYSEQYAQAVDDYSRVLELSPQLRGALNGRGHVLAELGQYQKAVSDLDLAIELSANDPITEAYARNGRALAYAGLRDYPRALEEFENALRLSPDNAWAYYNRGLTHEWMGEHEKALGDFKMALEKADPKLIPLKRARIKGWLEPSKI